MLKKRKKLERRLRLIIWLARLNFKPSARLIAKSTRLMRLPAGKLLKRRRRS